MSTVKRVVELRDGLARTLRFEIGQNGKFMSAKIGTARVDLDAEAQHALWCYLNANKVPRGD